MRRAPRWSMPTIWCCCERRGGDCRHGPGGPRRAAGAGSGADGVKAHAIRAAAATIRARAAELLADNAADCEAARLGGLSEALIDRLALNEARVEAMAAGLETVAALPDPVGEIIREWQQPNGLAFARVRVPLGVIGIIYEARPGVTADAAALCLMAGNACLLRGGSEAMRSNRLLLECVATGWRRPGCRRRRCRWSPPATGRWSAPCSARTG